MTAPKQPFKVIIAGGRDFHATSEDLFKIDRMVARYYNMKTMEHSNGGLEFVTGTAIGADQIPYYYQSWHGVPIKEFVADWEKHGKKAGVLRNIEMAKYANALIAYWDKKSKGTKHMIDIATKLGLKVKVFNY